VEYQPDMVTQYRHSTGKKSRQRSKVVAAVWTYFKSIETSSLGKHSAFLDDRKSISR